MLSGRTRGGLGQVTVLSPLHRKDHPIVIRTRGSRLIWLGRSKRTLFSSPSVLRMVSSIDIWLKFESSGILARLIPERSASFLALFACGYGFAILGKKTTSGIQHNWLEQFIK
jgi:hypothetical protein